MYIFVTLLSFLRINFTRSNDYMLKKSKMWQIVFAMYFDFCLKAVDRTSQPLVIFHSIVEKPLHNLIIVETFVTSFKQNIYNTMKCHAYFQ